MSTGPRKGFPILLWVFRKVSNWMVSNLTRLAGIQTTNNPSDKKSSYIIMIFPRPKMDHAQSQQSGKLSCWCNPAVLLWLLDAENKKHRFLTLNEATEIGVLRISGGLCAYIEFRHSKNAEISTLKWSSLCMKPLQKMEFIGSSRQKFQNHCLQNYKQKPPENASLSHFPVVF